MKFQIDTLKNLQNLLRQLKTGTYISGKILEKIDETKYILRIHGYNIITESEKTLKKGDELNFIIKNNNNHLYLKLIRSKQFSKNNRLNIVI